MNSKAILMLTLSNVGSVQPGCFTLDLWISGFLDFWNRVAPVGGCLVWHFHIIFEYYMRISISSSGLQQNVCPSIGGFLWGVSQLWNGERSIKGGGSLHWVGFGG